MTSSSCEIPTDFVDEFQATPFENTAAIEFFHSRYGRTTNILDLMEGTPEEQRDYMKGVIYSSTAIFVVVVVWMLILLLFKAMGPSQVGILSGRQVKLRGRSSEDYKNENNNSDDEDGFEERYEKASKRLKIYRMIVVYAGISMVISSILMAVKGIESLTSSLNDGREGIAIVSSLTQGGIDIIDSVLDQNDQAGVLVEDLLVNINEICPKVRDPLCVDLNDISTCNFDGIFDTDTVQAVVGHFRDSERSVVYVDLVQARDDLKRLLKVAKDIDEQAAQFNWALYLAMAFSLCLAVLTIFILVGILFPQQKRATRCLRSWILIPIFILFVILSFVFCLTFIFGSIVLADMCVDSPDSRIQVLLDRFQDELSPILIEFVNFYINQCPADQLPQEVTEQIIYFRDAISLVSDFTGMLAQTSTTNNGLEAICGFEDFDTVSALARSTNENLCSVAGITVTIREYYQCRNWYPLYETTIYEAMCYNGTEGFAWVAGTQFVVVIMAMILLTFRGAFQDVEVLDEDDDDSNHSDNIERVATVQTVRLTPPRRDVKVSPSQNGGGFELSPHRDFQEYILLIERKIPAS